MKRQALVIMGILALLLGLHTSGSDQIRTGSVQLPPDVIPQSPGLTADYGKIPLYFIPNKGQVDGPAAFYVQGGDKTIYFAPDGLTLVLNSSRVGSPSERWAVKLDFVDANRDTIPVSLGESGALISYFKGKPEDWKTGLPASSKIIYREIWPGIDLLYYGTMDRMKCEFFVHPGADPSRIRLAYRGADSVVLTEEGRLAISTPVGGFEDDVPVAWQEAGGVRTNVAVAYALEAGDAGPNGPRHVYGFRPGPYDKGCPLVLDPAILVYCGFIGGASEDEGKAIAVDGAGNAYVTGYAYFAEGTFPVTVGPDLTYNGDPCDAFVAKVNAAGTGLVYCGYIGGSGIDEAAGIAVDGEGNAYVAGETSSGDFPVTPGSTLTYKGDIDAFVVKVDAAGTGLIYSGHIGGWNWDTGKGIAVDSSGNAYVAGWTFSDDLPVKVGPDLTYNGSQDAFVAKVNAAGTALVYCGYIGGWANEETKAIAVDRSGNAYITGRAATDFPVKVGPDLTHNGLYDVFVAKVNAAGSDLVYGGYIGGGDDEDANGIAVDGSGNAYITGYTYSTDLTRVAGPDLTFNGGSTDAFVAKVKADGTGLAYCGYMGGGPSDRGWGNDCGNGIAVDQAGNAYVTGQTDSAETSFPVTVGPDLTDNGLDEAFIAKVKADGTGLVYCGYIGGEADEWGRGVAVDGAGNAYVTGLTNSSEATFPAKVGPNLTYYGNGSYDIFVAKISPNNAGFIMEASPASATVEAGQSATYTIQATLQFGSIASAITFSASDLPRGCTASFSPASVTLGAGTASTSLTLTTTARAGSGIGGIMAAAGRVPPAPGWLILISAIGLWIPLRRSVPIMRSRRWLGVGALIGLIVLSCGCGAGDPADKGTLAGNYRITVEGTSGSLTAQTQVTLVVQ